MSTSKQIWCLRSDDEPPRNDWGELNYGRRQKERPRKGGNYRYISRLCGFELRNRTAPAGSGESRRGHSNQLLVLEGSDSGRSPQLLSGERKLSVGNPRERNVVWRGGSVDDRVKQSYIDVSVHWKPHSAEWDRELGEGGRGERGAHVAPLYASVWEMVLCGRDLVCSLRLSFESIRGVRVARLRWFFVMVNFLI